MGAQAPTTKTPKIMAKRINIEVARSNKREKTITIRCTYDDGSKIYYKSLELTKEEFHYYTNHATQHDLENFLKNNEYYELK